MADVEPQRSLAAEDEDQMTTIDLEGNSDIGGPEAPSSSSNASASAGDMSAHHADAGQNGNNVGAAGSAAASASGPIVTNRNGGTVTSATPGTTTAPPPAPVHPGQLDPTMRFWFPALFSFYDIIMASDDLEVRRLALASLFDLLKQHGGSFPSEFWDTICKEILFPIFSVLRRPSASASSNAAGTGQAQSPSSATASPSHKFAALPPVAGPSNGSTSAGSGINVLQEEMSVWLSTTMIQALRNLVELWTHFFSELERLLPELLELLCACICQENDTLARIGTSCLQTLVEKNVDKLSPQRWEQVVDAMVKLFNTTTAHALFDPALRAVAPEPGTPGYAEYAHLVPPAASNDGPPLKSPSPYDSPYEYSYHYQQMFPARPPMASAERRRAFKQIIVKCVLQLLLIETTQELLNGPASSGPTPRTAGHRASDASSTMGAAATTRNHDALSHVLPPQEMPASAFYSLIPPAQLLRLTHVLEASYAFSRAFNVDKELRLALWKVGFMKQLPNLLKQESSSAATLVRVLVRMHADPRQEHRSLRKEVRRRLVPLGREVVKGYLPLDPDTQARNIGAWTPVVADIFRGLCTFEDTELEVLDAWGRVEGARMPSRLKTGKAAPVRRRSGHAFEMSVDDDDDEFQPPSSPEIGDETVQSAGPGSTPSNQPKAYGVFQTHARTFYPLAVELLSKDPLPPEVGESLRHYFWKVGLSVGFVDLASLRAERERERERERREEERREVMRARERELDRERARVAEEARARREHEERERERRRWEAQRLAQAQAQAERDRDRDRDRDRNRERERIQQEREQIQREKEELQRQIAAEAKKGQASAATAEGASAQDQEATATAPAADAQGEDGTETSPAPPLPPSKERDLPPVEPTEDQAEASAATANGSVTES